jgi:hypothetical protein
MPPGEQVLKAPLPHRDRAEHRHRSDMPAFNLVIKSNAAWVIHAIAVTDATVVAVWVAVVNSCLLWLCCRGSVATVYP